MRSIIFLVMLLAVLGCVNPEATKAALEKSGYTEVKTEGFDLFACSEDDFYHTKFKAKNIAGQEVSGTVCCGFIFKGCTVRF